MQHEKGCCRQARKHRNNTENTPNLTLPAFFTDALLPDFNIYSYLLLSASYAISDQFSKYSIFLYHLCQDIYYLLIFQYQRAMSLKKALIVWCLKPTFPWQKNPARIAHIQTRSPAKRRNFTGINGYGLASRDLPEDAGVFALSYHIWLPGRSLIWRLLPARRALLDSGYFNKKIYLSLDKTPLRTINKYVKWFLSIVQYSFVAFPIEHIPGFGN